MKKRLPSRKHGRVLLKPRKRRIVDLLSLSIIPVGEKVEGSRHTSGRIHEIRTDGV